MADTKRISKRSHTSLRLKRTEPVQAPLPGAEPAKTPHRRRARTGRVEAMRATINADNFELDATFAGAIARMIERELD